MTGIRSWTSATTGLASVVRMVKVSTGADGPSSGNQGAELPGGGRHRSKRPASANGPPVPHPEEPRLAAASQALPLEETVHGDEASPGAEGVAEPRAGRRRSRRGR